MRPFPLCDAVVIFVLLAAAVLLAWHIERRIQAYICPIPDLIILLIILSTLGRVLGAALRPSGHHQDQTEEFSMTQDRSPTLNYLKKC
jgi:hypothetical protein